MNLEANPLNLDTINQTLSQRSAAEIITWAADVFGSQLVMTTSFGIQSAVMLHLATQIVPDIPVIWIDTGYLPPATYRFAQALTDRLHLNLQVFQATLSPARMEALHGRLWTQGTVEALNLYDRIRKVEPMQRALKDLGARAWLAGLRRDQTTYRQNLGHIARQQEIYKIHPILAWSAQEVDQYLNAYDLPYHPMKDMGYATVGDWHSSRPMTDKDEHERQTRFQGMKQECGLHLPQTQEESDSFDSSSL
ncbi:phosphoadenylyl-sulfate reductase [Lyngbya confervoides BDU141951]|uniref:Phosphoadenosine 5'-phosphosulfate reductase n=1 Tax=Lyngbya confervoides BDU141951 TaxID=1574623 RepID=A0ABD4T5D4_9CYAN|nr:phosphoadenylyl-sulfate reductase [Lyngbya confervoides]MCM1983851.1 phosphoadenylyl-sulfate reductase [Lyngbya confervoides BDU141951]